MQSKSLLHRINKNKLKIIKSIYCKINQNKIMN